MKGFIVATLVALTIGAIALNQYSNKSVETYGDRISKIVDKVNSMNSTWKAGTNARFANMSPEAIKSSMMSVEFVQNKKATNQYFRSYAKVAEAPASFDSRAQWPECESIRKSETNLLVDHVGLSVLLKLCQTEFVSTLVKLTKPESQPLI